MTLKISMKTRPINMQPMKTALIASLIDIDNDAKANITRNKNIVTGRGRASVTYSMSDMRSEFDTAIATPGHEAIQPTESDRIERPITEMHGKVGTNVWYMQLLEFMKGGIYAFLRPAFIGQVNNIKERFRKALREAING